MPAAEVALGDDGAVFACFLGVGRNHFGRDEVPIALDGEVELAVRFAMSMPSSGSICHKEVATDGVRKALESRL